MIQGTIPINMATSWVPCGPAKRSSVQGYTWNFKRAKLQSNSAISSPDHTTPEEFENATTTGQFGFVADQENSVREILLLSRCHRFPSTT